VTLRIGRHDEWIVSIDDRPARYTSPRIPTTLSAGTELEVYTLREADMLAYQSPPRAEVRRDSGASTLTVRFRLYSLVNLFLGRFPFRSPGSRGSGLIAPVF
jgi:hypothetical protein